MFDERATLGLALLPCPASGPGPGAPPCSLLRDMAADGQAMCHLAGARAWAYACSEWNAVSAYQALYCLG
jgi:hypothetical protein